VNTCGTNHAQLWLNQPLPVIAGGKLYSYTEFVNVHTRESLALSATTAGTRVLHQSSGDTLWTVPWFAADTEVAWSWSWSWPWPWPWSGRFVSQQQEQASQPHDGDGRDCDRQLAHRYAHAEDQHADRRNHRDRQPPAAAPTGRAERSAGRAPVPPLRLSAQ
jgi:hypothetical protein